MHKLLYLTNVHCLHEAQKPVRSSTLNYMYTNYILPIIEILKQFCYMVTYFTLCMRAVRKLLRH